MAAIPANAAMIPQSTQAIVDPRYCAHFPTTFYGKDKVLSWSNGDVTILDEQRTQWTTKSGVYEEAEC